MPVPIFQIFADGKDVTGNLLGLGLSMSITDNEGLTEDTLSLTIDDPEGMVEAPRRGAVLRAIGGYEGVTRDFGEFSVDTVTYTGWPQMIEIGAKSVAAKSLAKEREPKSYITREFPTYGDILAEIAKKAKVGLRVSEKIKSLKNPSEYQTEEGALEFLTRIGPKINAAITVKSGTLCVVEKGQETSVSGESLDRVVVARGFNFLGYSVTESDEESHKEVEASYYDRDKNKRETVVVPTGLEGPKFLLRSPYQNEEEAERAAKSQSQELARAIGDASFEIDGNPFAQAEAYATVSGARSNVDGIWRIKTVTHNFSSSGPYVSTLSCTAPSQERLEAEKAGGGEKRKGKMPSPSGNGSYLEAGPPSLTGNPSTNIG